MNKWATAALAVGIPFGLSACGGSDSGAQGQGDIPIQLIDPPVAEVPEERNIENTPLPLVETFGDYSNFDQADTINFFSPDYKSLASASKSP